MTDAYFPLPYKLNGSNTGFHTEIVGRLSMRDNPLTLHKHQEIEVISISLGIPFKARYLGKRAGQVLVFPIEIARLTKFYIDFTPKENQQDQILSHTEFMEYFEFV